MITILQSFILVVLVYIAAAFDPFQGLIQQGEPCFEIINADNCDLPLNQVFSPTYKGSNINRRETQLWLFTVTNPEKAEPLHQCGGRLPDDSDFNANIDTVVITHGWVDGVCRTAWMRELKDQLFLRDDYNIILVDWTWANSFEPIEAAANALVVGEEMAFVIINIMEQTKMTNGDKFHLIGHSYGAPAINEAAKYIIVRDPSKKVRRLTFLDPAVVPVEIGDYEKSRNLKYAKFIDVIHGNAATCGPLNFGLLTPVGHVDFYPNGGSFQASCYPYAIRTLLRGDLIYGTLSLLYPPLCSHLQAIQYFKVSINHPQGLYIGAECNSYQDFLIGDCHRCCKDDFSKCAVMGMDSETYFPRTFDPYQNRTYYLNLGLECPYNEDYEFSIFRNC